MSNGTPATIPAHTVLGTRAQGERLGFQEFHLVLINTDGAGKSFPISDTTLKIGKSPDNDVVIDQPTVSRNHLVIRRQGDRFLVEDLQSTNGTFIDGACSPGPPPAQWSWATCSSGSSPPSSQ
jgi:hypothetical protein